METIPLNLKETPYNIITGYNIIGELGRTVRKLEIGTDAYIISNPTIKNKYGNLLAKSLKKAGLNHKFNLVADTEKSKSLKNSFNILRDIAYFAKNKKIFIIAFGGGVVGDLAGFIASIYKRGIPYVQVPTTLLAQIDSSIGGKTAVDLPEGKNLIGTFYQPRLVFSDASLLKSLPPRHLRAGLAEAVKYGVIKNRCLFEYIEDNYPDILKAKEECLEFIISRSSRIKAEVVRQDEKEKKDIRTILNFGHTIGHAIETAGGYRKFSHGEAVGLGMIAAGYISEDLGLIGRQTTLKIKTLIDNIGLPVKIKAIALKKIIEAHYFDKKFSGRQNKFVLIENIGKTRIMRNIPLTIITKALKRIT